MDEEKGFGDLASPEVKIEESRPGNSAYGNDPLIRREPKSMSRGCCCSSKRVESVSSMKEDLRLEKRLSRQERVELCRQFQGAVSSYNWELAESLIKPADPPTLNDELCMALDSIWFLGTHQELEGVTDLIKKIISNGARDFARAAMRTSFLASCVSACLHPSMSLVDTAAVMAPRLHKQLQECNAGARADKFAGWAFRCIDLHSRGEKNRGRLSRNLALEIQLRLAAFRTFLDLAGSHLTGRDFTEAFDAACYPLTLFLSTFDPGWVSGVSAAAVHGLLSLLVERGADNVNQCFLEASRCGSTDLVRILLQVPHHAIVCLISFKCCQLLSTSRYGNLVLFFL
ncbi:hypothetical protein SAY86_019338 [Trapa natans]|uniref:Ankyrin repeat protein SKIP35 n=1 Tax=Trapa natans TaxID=22666 RepID=A0AAN7LN08_TRANT|nr:hypothetical protein SAY86_019338 [Trapa natans]